MNCIALKKSNCKNCYKCIRHCPVKAIRFSGNQAYIIDNECILCGHCFVVCPQNAKQIVDETEKAKVLIQSPAPVIASIAPSFVANYDGVGIEAMRDATKYLIGPKNFTSFTDDKECKDPVRKIVNIKIVSSGDKVRITYYGTGFLYHMVRILTGTLLEIGAGKRDASMLPVVIAAEDRSLAGFLAPARGLFLRKVYY